MRFKIPGNAKLIELIKRYKGTMLLTLFILLIAVYPLVVTLINPIPAQSELRTISATIIELKEDAPSMKVRFSNGEIQTLYFPQTLYWMARGNRKYVLRKGYADKLMNCDAYIKIENIRWLVPSRVRIWEINCPKQSISFEQFSSDYRREQSYSNWIELFVVLLLGFVLFKKVKEDQRK